MTGNGHPTITKACSGELKYAEEKINSDKVFFSGSERVT